MLDGIYWRTMGELQDYGIDVICKTEEKAKAELQALFIEHCYGPDVYEDC